VKSRVPSSLPEKQHFIGIQKVNKEQRREAPMPDPNPLYFTDDWKEFQKKLNFVI
jgi:hypothetical protein